MAEGAEGGIARGAYKAPAVKGRLLTRAAQNASVFVGNLQSHDRKGVVRRRARINDRSAIRTSALSAYSALSGFEFLVFPLRLCVSAVNSSSTPGVFKW